MMILLLLLQDPLERAVRDAIARLREDVAREIEREFSPHEFSIDEKQIDRALRAISERRLRRTLTYLASDELEGRGAGWPGNDKAADYIAEQFADAGLGPVGGSYFQEFTIPGTELKTRNCMGLLEGTELPDEYVVIGAHHDHVGRWGQQSGTRFGRPTGDDAIWNGADDNGSGTTAVLAIAHAFKRAGVRPRRSVVFMTFSAEEWGLFGSKHYVAHPLIPLEKTVAMLNLDMVGRGSTETHTGAYGCGTASGFSAIALRAGRRAGLDLAPGAGYGGGSDHVSFADAGVPILGIGENGVGQSDYHRATDHADRIDYDYMALLARAAFLCLVEVANGPRPEWNPAFKRPEAPQGRSLGVNIEEATDEVEGVAGGALRIMYIRAGSAAQRAGLRPGDVIVAVGGAPLPREEPRSALQERIKAAEKTLEVEVVRGGRRVTIRAEWKD